MCTLALYRQRFAPYPLVVAANRDELYDRPTAPPHVIAQDPWIVAGQDLSAGGTWLGVNQSGMVVGLLNRRRPGGIAAVDPSLRSRGLLALEMLHCRSVERAIEQLGNDDGARYNGFNLLIATPSKAYVAHNAEQTIAITKLDPGVHLLTNLELNDPTCPRIAKSARLFESVAVAAADPAEALVERLTPILSDHSTPLDPRSPLPLNNLCVHTERFGTCSSSIIVFSAEQRRYRLWHAPGAPCATAFGEVTLPN